MVYLIPRKHLIYKYTITNIKYEKVKNDEENIKLIAKYSFENPRFNWSLNKVVFGKTRKCKVAKETLERVKHVLS